MNYSQRILNGPLSKEQRQPKETNNTNPDTYIWDKNKQCYVKKKECN